MSSTATVRESALHVARWAMLFVPAELNAAVVEVEQAIASDPVEPLRRELERELGFLKALQSYRTDVVQADEVRA